MNKLQSGVGSRIRQRRRIRWSGIAAQPAAKRPNERWSMDFVSDRINSGRVIRTLTLVDDCTRECLAIEVDISPGRTTRGTGIGSGSRRARLAGGHRSG
jgi:transposase InsO family protein